MNLGLDRHYAVMICPRCTRHRFGVVGSRPLCERCTHTTHTTVYMVGARRVITDADRALFGAFLQGMPHANGATPEALYGEYLAQGGGISQDTFYFLLLEATGLMRVRLTDGSLVCATTPYDSCEKILAHVLSIQLGGQR